MCYGGKHYRKARMNPSTLGFSHAEWRPGQIELIKQIQEWYHSPTPFLLVEAPPGWGKSLVVLATLELLHKQDPKFRGLVTTQTLNLQRQYAREHKNVQTAWGKTHHPCLITPVNVLDGPCNYGYSCQYRNNECTYFAELGRAERSHLPVLNGAFYLHNQGKVGSRLLACYDEAHELERLCRDFATVSLDPDLLAELGPLPNAIDREYLESIREPVDARAAVFQRSAAELAFDPAPPPDGKEWFYLSRDLDRLTNLLSYDLIQEGYTFQPIWGEPFTDYLFGNARKHLLISATLPEKYTTEMLGITDYEYITLPSPFPVENRKIVYHPVVKVSAKITPAKFLSLVQVMDDYLDRHVGERGIIHTVSYARAEMVMAMSRHRDRMITHRSGKRDWGISEFLNGPDDAIFVSPAVMTGEDFGAGDNCRFNVIVKYPIPGVGDKVSKRRADEKPETLWTEADQMFVQAQGRGTRSAEDYSVTYIFDSTFGWRKQFLPRYIQEAVRG